MTKIDQFNEEESSFGYDLSQYPKRKAIFDRLVPFKKLFDAGHDFLDKHHTWMSAKVKKEFLRVCIKVENFICVLRC